MDFPGIHREFYSIAAVRKSSVTELRGSLRTAAADVAEHFRTMELDDLKFL
jgi:hypothetical protein